MTTLFAFLLTLIEIIYLGATFFTPENDLFHRGVIYGSPFYILTHLSGHESVFSYAGFFFPFAIVFHLVKYGSLFHAQLTAERSTMLYMAILFEAIYLGVGAYYNFSV
jgi:hypothetical protein